MRGTRITHLTDATMPQRQQRKIIEANIFIKHANSTPVHNSSAHDYKIPAATVDMPIRAFGLLHHLRALMNRNYNKQYGWDETGSPHALASRHCVTL